MKILRKAINFFHGAINFLAVIANGLIAFCLFAVLYSVIIRLFLPLLATWVIDVTSLAVAGICFLGTTLVLREEGHIKITLFFDRLNVRTQNLVQGITSIIGAISFIILTWYGVVAIWGNFSIGHYRHGALNIPDVWYMWIFPVGTFLLFVQFSERAYRNLVLWMQSRKNYGN